MISIERFGPGYKIKFSDPGSGRRGFSVRVRDVRGIHTAIDHYFIRDHEQASCALCDLTKSEDKAKDSRRRRDG